MCQSQKGPLPSFHRRMRGSSLLSVLSYSQVMLILLGRDGELPAHVPNVAQEAVPEKPSPTCPTTDIIGHRICNFQGTNGSLTGAPDCSSAGRRWAPTTHQCTLFLSRKKLALKLVLKWERKRLVFSQWLQWKVLPAPGARVHLQREATVISGN